jgi:hypothetical protein
MQLEIRRRMTPEQCLQVAFELSELSREIRKAGIRREHPDWSELEVIHELIREAFHSEPVPEWLERKMQQRLDEQRARKLANIE